MTEFFDEVDCNDKILGKISREAAHSKGLRHRAVHIFIRSENNRWLIQKRSAIKDIDPLLWTTSCSGHVDAGEEYVDAAVRECKEELGINISATQLVEILRCSPCKETGMEFVRIYFLERSIKDIRPSKDEVLEAKAKTISEIYHQISLKRDTFSSSFLHLFWLISAKLSRL